MIAGLLLAAGRARRFGADKLLAPLPDGTPLALAALRPLRAAVDEVIAVVHSRTATARLLAAEGARVIIATDSDDGIGASLAAGMRALADTPPTDQRQVSACLIALADMPMVRPTTIEQLVAALAAGASMVAPEYRGTRGQPVGFAREWFGFLSRLRGDEGARHLLAVHRERLQRVPVDDPGILTDIDRPSDLETLSHPAALMRC